MTRSILSRLVLLMAILAPAISHAQTTSYSVTGVDASDTLNIRAGLEGASGLGDTQIVGEIPANASGIEATGRSVDLNGRLWREIRYQGVDGWVAARFLRTESVVSMPADLRCGGTEPFWGLAIAGSYGEFTSPNDDKRQLSVVGPLPGRNRGSLWSYRMTDGGGAVFNGLVVYTDQCSDGMSDFSYAFEIYLIGTDEASGPMQGCCSFGR